MTGKIPVYRDGVVEYVQGDPETRDPVYTAMGVFITAYARDVTIRAAQTNYATFAYADTDSLHLLSPVDPDTLEIHPNKLGAWKREYVFESALFVRAKTYTEVVDGKHITHIAGLPVHVQETMTYAHFTPGTYLPGKLTPKRVPGGVVLLETGFTMP